MYSCAEDIESEHIKKIIDFQDKEIEELAQKILILSQFSLFPEVIKIIYNYLFQTNISLGIRIWAQKINNKVFLKKNRCWRCKKLTYEESLFTIHCSSFVRMNQSLMHFFGFKRIFGFIPNDSNKICIRYDIHCDGKKITNLESESDIPIIQE